MTRRARAVASRRRAAGEKPRKIGGKVRRDDASGHPRGEKQPPRVATCSTLRAVMAGDGKTWESAAEDDNKGAEPESGAPSSRGKRSLLAADVGERTDSLHGAVQPGGNATRLSPVREVPRFQPVSRHEHQQRKRARRSEQAAARAGTPTAPLPEVAGHSALTGTAELGITGDAPGTADTPIGGKRARKRQTRRKPSSGTMATRRLLPVVAGTWNDEVAAFTARGMAPPLPYRPTDHAEAFELTAEHRRALRRDQIRHLNAKPAQCVARALGAVPLLDEWRPRMAVLPVKLELIDLIPTLARALSHADARLAVALEIAAPAFMAQRETPVFTRRELLHRMVRLALEERARLHSEIRNLVTLKRVAPNALSNLKGGKGFSNVAHDVLTLLELRRAAVAAGARSNLSEEDSERCRVLAYALFETNARTPNGVDAVRAAALEERSRAFTLLWLAYSEAERAFAFIFWSYGKQRTVLQALV